MRFMVLALKKCGKHPMHAHHNCQICSSYESEKRRVNATPGEFSKQPCETHKEAVCPTCPDCILWAANCNDFGSEAEVDFSVAEPNNIDLCRFLTDQVTFE